MSLQKSAAAFKSSLTNAADFLPSRPKAVAKPAASTTPVSAPPAPKRKRPVNDGPPAAATPAVYSQPATLALSNQHIFTQVHHAIQYLKEKERPLTPRDIASYLSVPLASPLFGILKTNERVVYDQANDTLAFRPLHNIRSPTDLLAYLQQQTTAQGLSVKELKDGWAGAMDAINTLEASEDILVTRTKKDNQPRMVWGNDKTLTCEIDDEFKDIWTKIKVPPAVEIVAELERMGLKPASVDPATIKKDVSKQRTGRKRAVNRRAKFSNTHMAGILKDSRDLKRGQ